MIKRIFSALASQTQIIPAASNANMIGAGVIHKKQTFITHTTLHHKESALLTFSLWQKLIIILAVFAFVFGLFNAPQTTAIVFISILTVIYFIDSIFSLFVVFKSLHLPEELNFDQNELEKITDNELPVYTILCPLYKEAEILPQFVNNISQLSYPKQKLEVLLLLEENDQETIEIANKSDLPSYFKIIIVPHSLPKTKPKACNYGLNFATGKLIVIYDAEDQPDIWQLKKSYLGFKKSPENVACLQAKLNYYNPHHNLLTRLFTAEYSLWFDVVLPGFQTINTAIPLGGTSNHFRTDILKKLKGWDPFNVTEDADLGVRIFKAGYKTAIIDSTTLEEANSKVRNWLRQRSRWIKGYFQTYLVHMRNPIAFLKNHGSHVFIFQLVVGARTTFMLINPILWTMTLLYFTAYKFVGPTIESLYPAPVFYMAATSLVLGNFLYLYNYMIGCAKKGHWNLIKFVFLIPVYWFLVSMAATIAAYQLITKPHFWEKTVHGFHLNQNENTVKRFPFNVSQEMISGGTLVIANVLGNFLNFAYNAYLGRNIAIEDFGLISLIGSFIYIFSIPLSALSTVVTHQTAFYLGKFEDSGKTFWKKTRKQSFLFALLISILWILLTPLLRNFFHTKDILPFILFTPVWFLGTLGSIDQGFISGNSKFSDIAIIAITEAATKLILSILFVKIGLSEIVYFSIPLSMFVSLIIGYIRATKIVDTIDSRTPIKFSKSLFTSGIFNKLSTVVFLSADLILAKHFLDPKTAGLYGFISLVGKMVYFFPSMFGQFVLPIISKNEGAGKNEQAVFIKLFVAIASAGLFAFIFFGAFSNITVPILWGEKTRPILGYLPVYTLALVLLSLTESITTFNIAKKRTLFPIITFVTSHVQIIGIFFFHQTISDFIDVTIISATTTFLACYILHIYYGVFYSAIRNLQDFLLIFFPLPKSNKLANLGSLRILVFNWRDTKHVWAGGAEVYIHELAKRWVKKGHEVTVFCGNDGNNARHENIDGVKIIRRGGFYFVYLWAFLYYFFRLRGKFDIIVDCENGLPFFTPLFALDVKKKFLVIHHVHQEVFRKSLKPPFSWLAMFLERRFMPIVYQNTEVITVSPSSKADILDHRLTKKDPFIIYNGVDLEIFKPGKKHPNPLVLYLGRLKDHKSLPVFIHSAKKVLQQIPDVEFIIAGDGPDKKPLYDLVKKLGLEDKIKFFGKVSEQEKLALYQKAWLFVNPSLMEGWGITSIEANACGTPVVASNVPGLRDSVKNPHSGILVPYGNIDAFASNIIDLIKNKKLLKTMSHDAIAWAKNFDWEKSADNALSIFI